MYCISYNLYKYIQRLSLLIFSTKGSWGWVGVPVTQVQGEERQAGKLRERASEKFLWCLCAGGEKMALCTQMELLVSLGVVEVAARGGRRFFLSQVGGKRELPLEVSAPQRSQVCKAFTAQRYTFLKKDATEDKGAGSLSFCTVGRCVGPRSRFLSFGIQKQVSRGTEGCGGGRGEAEGSWVVQREDGLTHGCDHTGGVVRGEWEARGRVHWCGGGQHVAGVWEGREGRHVAGQGGRTKGAALVHQALGEVIHVVLGLFALLGLAGHLPVPGLDAFLLHGQRSVDLLSKGDRKDGRLVFRHSGSLEFCTHAGWIKKQDN